MSTSVSASSVDPTIPSRFRLDIQGLRGIAVLAVVVFHVHRLLPGGYAGVDLFFVISGFVITAPLVAGISEWGVAYLGTFFRRRITRLSPALAVMVTISTLAAILLSPSYGGQEPIAKVAVGAIFSVSNIILPLTTGGYFDSSADANAMLHTWSLSVEEQFYLIFPIITLLFLRLTSRRPLVLLVLTSVVSFGMASAVNDFGYLSRNALLGFYSPLGRLWEFGVGGIIALSPRGFVSRRLAHILGWLGLLAVVASFVLIDSSAAFPGIAALPSVAGGSLLIVAGQSDASVSRLLSSQLLRWLGDRSYSLYLWHWPLIVFVSNLFPDSLPAAALAAAGSLIPAALSYRWVESPCRARGRTASWRTVARIWVLFALPALLCSSLLWAGGKALWWNPILKSWVPNETAPGWNHCLDLLETDRDGGRFSLPNCAFGRNLTGAPVYLVGDSNAAMFSPGVIAGAKASGRPVYESTAAGCAFLLVERRTSPESDRRCRSYVEDVLTELRTAPAGSTVVIGLTASHWGLEGREYADNSGRFSTSFQERNNNLTNALKYTVETLQANHLRVVLIQPMYWTGEASKPVSAMLCKTTVEVWLGRCPTAATPDDFGPASKVARQAVADVALQTKASLVDAASAQCPRGHCEPRIGPFSTYQDGGHLSVAATQKLAPLFASVLARS